jgi:hypothetical protein
LATVLLLASLVVLALELLLEVSAAAMLVLFELAAGPLSIVACGLPWPPTFTDGSVVGVCGVTVCAIATPSMPAVATVDAAVIQNLFAFIFFAPEKLKIKNDASANADDWTLAPRAAKLCQPPHQRDVGLRELSLVPDRLQEESRQ